MAKDRWKCPYSHCKQEFGRHWNMVRHIARKHGGLGIPVNDKSSTLKQPVSEVFLKDNKLLAFYSKQPSNERHKEESDIVDTIYDKVKKAKAREDKIKEIKSFFPSHSTQRFLYHRPLTLAQCPMELHTCRDRK
jgi:hypothetical protein